MSLLTFFGKTSNVAADDSTRIPPSIGVKVTIQVEDSEEADEGEDDRISFEL